MDALLIGMYAFIVWLIYFKFKWLPWNTPNKVVVFTIPVVAMTWLILTLNAVAPTSTDARVIKYVVQIVPNVRGRVLEVPVDGNKPVKKGDVLFKIDPTPYQLQVNQLKAQLTTAEANAKNLNEQLRSTRGKTAAITAQLALARKRVVQNKALVASEAGNKFDLEQAEANVAQLEAEQASAKAAEDQVRESLGAVVGGDQAEVASIKAQLASAEYDLSQTTVYAPANGSVINLQVRPGSWVTPLPAMAAMSFVEDEYQIIALYGQNELYMVKPGDEVELAFETLPGDILKGKVESIVWAQGQGQLAQSGLVPTTGTGPTPPGRFAVKIDLEGESANTFLAAGAIGQSAIYTDSFKPIHLIRKVFVRVSSKLNYLIAKLH
ncbi:HlyD family secretion protein [Niveibacterium sp. SC-1]|uniref:HlyD family secretion protein n=1 Tax=Niveibacterium sp. SC-1 TaxID=3135646 RepID=UPI00311F11FF